MLAVFTALSDGNQGTRAHTLLLALVERAKSRNQGSRTHLSPFYNLTIRALVKEGRAETAMELLNEAVKAEDIVMEHVTVRWWCDCWAALHRAPNPMP